MDRSGEWFIARRATREPFEETRGGPPVKKFEGHETGRVQTPRRNAPWVRPRDRRDATMKSARRHSVSPNDDGRSRPIGRRGTEPQAAPGASVFRHRRRLIRYGYGLVTVSPVTIASVLCPKRMPYTPSVEPSRPLITTSALG